MFKRKVVINYLLYMKILTVRLKNDGVKISVMKSDLE